VSENESVSSAAIKAELEKAAAVIAAADALLITAGAGMGVDSGLPDFRGDEGFWKAYPPFRERGLSFVDVADPHWFHAVPQQAWGFYGHRRNLYRATAPHAGFEILKRWAGSKTAGYFIFTSNVDAHFQRAGFSESRIIECHGSLEHLQCAKGCCRDIWEAGAAEIDIDETTFRAALPLPKCKQCGGVARPNVLMFNDWDWFENRRDGQQLRYLQWLAEVERKRVAVIEMGAGLAVPTVRYESERRGGTLIRINPREPQAPQRCISVPCGALQALQAIDGML